MESSNSTKRPVSDLEGKDFSSKRSRPNDSSLHERGHGFGRGFSHGFGREMKHKGGRGFNPRDDRGFGPRDDRGFGPRDDRGFGPRGGRGFEYGDGRGLGPRGGRGFEHRGGRGFEHRGGREFNPRGRRGFGPRGGRGFSPRGGRGSGSREGSSFAWGDGRGFISRGGRGTEHGVSSRGVGRGMERGNREGSSTKDNKGFESAGGKLKMKHDVCEKDFPGYPGWSVQNLLKLVYYVRRMTPDGEIIWRHDALPDTVEQCCITFRRLLEEVKSVMFKESICLVKRHLIRNFYIEDIDRVQDIPEFPGRRLDVFAKEENLGSITEENRKAIKKKHSTLSSAERSRHLRVYEDSLLTHQLKVFDYFKNHPETIPECTCLKDVL